jgi:hypothetical protein
MRIQPTTASLWGAGVLMSTLLLTAPGPALAQDASAEEPQVAATDTVQPVDQEEMTHYVELQLEIDLLREEAIREMAQTHSADGRSSIRTNLTEAIREAHESHEMTPERYKSITFLISSDTDVRELFEATMATARGEESGS